MASDEHVYGFDYPVARTLKAISGVEAPETGQARLGRSAGYIVKTPGGGIAARSGTTVTVVNCDVYYLDGTGSTRTLTQVSGLTVPVANMSASAAVAGNAFILPTWHGGCLVANWEDC